MTINNALQTWLPIADQHLRVVRAGIDGGVLAALFTTFVGWMGPLGAILAVLWYSAELYESKFVQDWLAKRAARKLAASVAQPQPPGQPQTAPSQSPPPPGSSG